MTYIQLTGQGIAQQIRPDEASNILSGKPNSKIETNSLTASGLLTKIDETKTQKFNTAKGKRKYEANIESNAINNNKNEYETQTEDDSYYIYNSEYESMMQKLYLANLKIEDFDIQKEPIGKGRFGEIYLARHREDGYILALKCFRKAEIDKEREKRVRRELSINGELNHHHILQTYGYFYDDEIIYLMMDYISEGDLFNVISRNSNGIDETFSADFIYQIATGLQYLHRHNIIHRDLKPENIMVKNYKLMLSDFGDATKIKNKELQTTFCGTLDYLSPEIILNIPYSFSTDMWSLGVIVYELIVGKPPFENDLLNVDEYTRQTHRDIITCNYTIPEYVSKEAKDLIRKLLVIDSSKRMTIDQVLKHPWVKRYTPNITENNTDTVFKRKKYNSL